MRWSWRKELILIPSVGHLKCGNFKQNVKQYHVIEQTLEALSSNSDDTHYSSSIIIVYRYFVETYEEKFIATVSNQ